MASALVNNINYERVRAMLPETKVTDGIIWHGIPIYTDKKVPLNEVWILNHGEIIKVLNIGHESND